MVPKISCLLQLENYESDPVSVYQTVSADLPQKLRKSRVDSAESTDQRRKSFRKPDLVMEPKGSSYLKWSKLALSYQAHPTKELADFIIRSSYPIVLKIARRFLRHDFQLEDLMQEGFIAVFKALTTFDHNRSKSFFSHLCLSIRWSLNNYCIANFGMILAGHQSQIQKKLFFHKDYYKYAMTCMKTDEDQGNEILDEIGKRTRLTRDEVKKAGECFTIRVLSLNSDFYLSGQHSSVEISNLEKILPSSDLTPEELYMVKEEKYLFGQVMEALKLKLSKKELYVLQRHFLNEEIITLAEIGREIGLSRSRVQQIRVNLLKKIRKIIARENIQTALN